MESAQKIETQPEQAQSVPSLSSQNSKVEEPKCDMYSVGQIPTGAPIKGYDFNQGVNYQKLFSSYGSTGLQANSLADSIKIINEAIDWRLSDEPITEQDDEEAKDPEYRKNTRCKIFLGYTSNMVSSGMRETIRYLAEHKMIDCIVTSGGGVQEDFIKCFNDFFAGDFNMDDTSNRKKLQCRIGNILVPAENYVRFQKWLKPMFKTMYKEQKEDGFLWTPSRMIHRMGKQINNPESIYYWCYKNDIPVFCPAITDGAIGDMLFMNAFKNDLVLDIIQDMKQICKMAMKAPKSCVLILGGGVPKHHILNSHIWRNGADFGVFINTGFYEDGSDSGAKPSEALTWGKLRLNSKFSKVFSEASLVFPILVAETFAKDPKRSSKLEKLEK